MQDFVLRGLSPKELGEIKTVFGVTRNQMT